MNLKYCIIIFLLLFSCMDEQIKGKGLSSIGFYSTPEEIIENLGTKTSGYKEHFMLGIAYKKKKEYKKSIHHFANSCFTSHRNLKLKLFPQPVYNFVKGYHLKSDYYNDAVYEIAHLFYLYQEHDYVIKLIDLISSNKNGLYRNAVLLKAKSLSALKKYNESISSLEKLLPDYEDDYSKSIIYIRLASIYEKIENYDKAIDMYLKVIRIDEKSWQSTTSADQILVIMPKTEKKLTDNEKLILAKALYYSKKFNEAFLLLKTINYNNSEDLNILLVKVFIRVKNDKELNSVLHKITDKNQTLNLLKVQADELWAMRNKANAIAIYKKIISSGNEPLAQESLKRIATYMEDKKIAGYETYILEYKNKYPNDAASENFLWLIARNKIKDKNLLEAEKYMEEALVKFPEGPNSDKNRFWLYKLYSEKREKEKANKMIKEIVVKNPDSSYTWSLMERISKNDTIKSLNNNYKASYNNNKIDDMIFYHTLLFFKEKNISKRSSRLKNIAHPDLSRYNSFEKSITSIDISSNYKNILKSIEKYFAVGYYQGIQRELKLIPQNNEENQKDKYIALAHYGRKYNHHFLALLSALELLKLNQLKENISLLPEESIKILFPFPFSECINSASKNYNVDKNVLYAVIKAESLFNHNAVSSAGAVGLMQLMPGTAKGIAKELDMKKYNLKNPCTSITFGAKYISWLKKYFKNSFELIVAGYNAGAGNVNKWQKNLDYNDIDYFTEFVPFMETRYYILRTKKFLTQYEIIYNK